MFLCFSSFVRQFVAFNERKPIACIHFIRAEIFILSIKMVQKCIFAYPEVKAFALASCFESRTRPKRSFYLPFKMLWCFHQSSAWKQHPSSESILTFNDRHINETVLKLVFPHFPRRKATQWKIVSKSIQHWIKKVKEKENNAHRERLVLTYN